MKFNYFCILNKIKEFESIIQWSYMPLMEDVLKLQARESSLRTSAMALHTKYSRGPLSLDLIQPA